MVFMCLQRKCPVVVISDHGIHVFTTEMPCRRHQRPWYSCAYNGNALSSSSAAMVFMCLQRKCPVLVISGHGIHVFTTEMRAHLSGRIVIYKIFVPILSTIHSRTLKSIEVNEPVRNDAIKIGRPMSE
jgi:hypothetical protein